MKKVIQRLDSVHQRLLDLVTPIDSRQFTLGPTDNEWSVGQIVHHLCLVEERVISELEKALTQEPQRINFFRRMIPTAIVASRLVRVKAPKGVNPLNPPEKDVAIENFNRARRRLKELCLVQGETRLRQLVFKHPFLGDITGMATISFVGYHEHRHYKQIREVIIKLQKPAR